MESYFCNCILDWFRLVIPLNIPLLLPEVETCQDVGQMVYGNKHVWTASVSPGIWSCRSDDDALPDFDFRMVAPLIGIYRDHHKWQSFKCIDRIDSCNNEDRYHCATF